MQPHEWGIVGSLVAMLFAIAGYLAHKTIDHGEKLAALTAHTEGIKERFDRQDEALDALGRNMEAMMRRFGLRTTSSNPPGSTGGRSA